MKGKKDRSIRKRGGVRGNIHNNKKNTLKKHRRKSNKKRTTSKKQKGGSILASIGIGAAATAVTAAAYKGYRMISGLNDKGYMFRLLNQEYISYSPKVIVVETPDFMKHYLECVSTVEFFQLLLSNREYLKSKTLQSLIKDSTKEEKISKKKLSSQYGEEYKELEELLDYTDYKNKNILESIELEESSLELDTKDENIKELRDLLLLTAKIPGSSLDNNSKSSNPEFQELIKLDRINPYLSVSTFRWQDVIYSGLYDEYFTSEVDDILRERNSEFLTRDNEKVRLQKIINHLSKDPNFIEGIRRKMIECSSKPRGYLDYVSSSISWDSQKKCLACPSQECLLYIYDFYQSFLEQEDDVLLIDKLYSIMICEARICVLSKCLALEAIRIQEGNNNKVRNIIHEIYKRDMKSPTGRSLELPNKLIPFSNQLGGADVLQGAQPPGETPAVDVNVNVTTQPEEEESSSVGEFFSSINPFSDEPSEETQRTHQPSSVQEQLPQEKITQSVAQAPVAQAPVAQAPVAQAPVAQAPVAQAPVAQAPVAQAPIVTTEQIPPVSVEPESQVIEQEQQLPVEPEQTEIIVEQPEIVNEIPRESIEQESVQIVGVEPEIPEDKPYVAVDPVIETHILSIENELRKQIPLHESRNELFDILGGDLSDQSNIVDKFMNYKLGENIKLKDIFINVFRNYTSDNALEEKDAAIQALFNNIKEYGMIFVDCFSLEFLLSAGNLFDKDVAYNDVVGLSDIVSKLFLEGKDKHASIMVVVLLKLADNPNRLYIIKNLFERIEDIRHNNVSLVSMLLSVNINLLTRVNKSKARMLERVANVYNSASKEKRVDVHTFSIWPYLSESETKIFEIPDHDISHYDTPNTNIYSRYEPLSQDCSHSVDEIKEMIRGTAPFSINAAMINNLERCRPKELKK
jgi:hypothetical protein